jgi:hypothetical protein
MLIKHKDTFPFSVHYVENRINNFIMLMTGIRDSAVGIATGYGLEDREIGVRVRRVQEFSLLHVVQTGSGAHSASYAMGTAGSFLEGKAAGA